MDLEAFIQSMQTRINDMLAGLPSDANIDAASAPGVATKSCRRFGSEMGSVFDALRNKAKEITTMAESKKVELTTLAKAEVIKDAAFLKENKLVREEDMNLAVTSAVNAQKDLQKGEVEKGVKAIREVAERRKKLVTDKVLTSAAAEALPDEVLEGDAFMDKVTKVKARVDKLAGLKSLAADPDAIKRTVTFPVTAEGDTAFDESFNLWDRASKSGGGTGAPLNPGGGGEAKPPLALF